MTELKRLFSVDGKLIVDTEGVVGEPMEAFERLILVQGKRRELIRRLEQLKGKVKITSPTAALDFVRLRTSDETWYLFGDQQPAWAEVTPVADKAISRKDVEGYFGECRESTFFKLGLKKTTVVATAGAYVVRRNIIHDSNHDIKDVYAIEERVLPDGGYAVILARRIPAKIDWRFPRFE